MQNIKISIHNRNLEAKKQHLQNWNISIEDKKSLLKFLDDLALGKVNKGFRVSETRQVKYLEILKVPLEYFNKPTSKLTLKDMEGFQKDISSNKLKSKKGEPFAPSTKADINKLLKVYLKWKLGNSEHFIKLTDWLDTKVPKKTPEYLTEQEIEKLYKYCKNPSERFLIAVLFDAGCRAEEFHNIRYEDIQLPKQNENFVKITFKEEYSKTKGRTISLFWKYSLEAVKQFLEERTKEGIKSNEVIFTNSYENSRQIIYRLGQKILNKSLYYHLFRHSSATYYASKLNRQELCYRYGWAFSSGMPDVYISRSGMQNKELDEKFQNTELEDLKKELDKEKQTKTIEIEQIRKDAEFLAKVVRELQTNQQVYENEIKEWEKFGKKLDKKIPKKVILEKDLDKLKKVKVKLKEKGLSDEDKLKQFTRVFDKKKHFKSKKVKYKRPL